MLAYLNSLLESKGLEGKEFIFHPFVFTVVCSYLLILFQEVQCFISVKTSTWAGVINTVGEGGKEVGIVKETYRNCSEWWEPLVWSELTGTEVVWCQGFGWIKCSFLVFVGIRAAGRVWVVNRKQKTERRECGIWNETRQGAKGKMDQEIRSWGELGTV